MIVVLVASSLLVISTQAASITDDQETCIAAAEQAGVHYRNFKYNVAHMIHSLTVEDVRFFFDETFPVANDIPTVNLNLTGPAVLPHTPSYPSKFKFPLGSTLDRILLNNDDPNTFSDRGRTTLEELSHAAHMLEMLYTTSKVYKGLDDIDVNTVCPCLVDEAANGIIEVLEFIAKVNHLEIDDSKSFEEQGLEISDHCTQNSRKGRALASKSCGYSGVNACPSGGSYFQRQRRESTQQARGARKILICPNVPELKDSESWKIFQHDITEPFEDVAGAGPMAKNVAIYLYCKISMLAQ